MVVRLMHIPDEMVPESEKYIYFIAPVGGGNVKIGCSYLPRARLVTFSGWSPVPLELLAQAKGIPCVERAIHLRFAEHRSHGEWFAPAAELMSFIAEVVEKARIPLRGLDVRAVGVLDRVWFQRLQAKDAA